MTVWELVSHLTRYPPDLIVTVVHSDELGPDFDVELNRFERPDDVTLRLCHDYGARTEQPTPAQGGVESAKTA